MGRSPYPKGSVCRRLVTKSLGNLFALEGKTFLRRPNTTPCES